MTGHLLLVDAANVVGSRPDGWWRDRPGAARRLIDQVRAAVDSGAPDPGVPDPGVPDAGVPDPGVPDAGVPDPGVPDPGAPDPGTLDATSVVVVLEGAARAAWPPGRVTTQGQTLEVVHADGSGDDLLVTLTEQATGPIAVVTADRELRARIRAAGGTVRGPRWLVDQLPTLK